MKIIEPKVEILSHIDSNEILTLLEKAGRTAYKSEDKITTDSAKKMIAHLIKMGHESVIEHFNITVRFTCDRGVSHEIVRHRIASFTQESTRYCNYGLEKFGNEITVIRPRFLAPPLDPQAAIRYNAWHDGCVAAESAYFLLLEAGATPQEARSVLPNSLKTEVVMTANMREWRHFIKLRGAKEAHPDIRYLALDLLAQFKEQIPIIFDDIEFN